MRAASTTIPEDPFNRKFNYGPATFDRRHVFALTYTYNVRMFSRTRGFVKAVLDGYEISGVTRLQSGPYLTVLEPRTRCSETVRADCLSSERSFEDGERGPNNWARRDAFAIAPDTRRGTCGVGTLLVQARRHGTSRCVVTFGLTERFKLRFQADIFNAFNRTNFRDLESNLSSAAFGTISTSGPPRNIQFG
jgi:hypothetical protein